jgi:AraC-like DNA-binding protein
VLEAPPALRGLVYGAWDVAAGPGVPLHELAVQALPEASVTLCFQFGEPLIVQRGEQQRTFRTHVSGVQNAALTFRPAGRTRSLVLKLAPQVANRVLGRPIAEVADGNVAFDDLFGERLTASLEDELAHAAGPAQRLAIAERFVTARLADPPRTHGADALIDAAVARIVASDGQIRIATLAAECGLGERQFARRFQAHAGLRPKALARIARLQAALRARQAGARWAEAACEAGYADQSHWAREFRQAAGSAPQRYFRNERADQALYNETLGTSVFFNTRFV